MTRHAAAEGRDARHPGRVGPDTLVAVAHGTRDPAGAVVVRALVQRVRTLRPGLDVRPCFLGLAEPSLEETLAGLTAPAVVVPLLLGTGHHVRTDIPRAVADAARGDVVTARALGPHPLLALALADRLARAGRTAGPVVLAAAGSGDAGANEDTRVMAGLLAARLHAPVVPAFLSAARPTPREAVAALRAAGHRDVALAPYLLGPGFFARKAAAAGADRTAEPLGVHDAAARLVLLRHEEAVRRGRESRSAGDAGAERGGVGHAAGR